MTNAVGKNAYGNFAELRATCLLQPEIKAAGMRRLGVNEQSDPGINDALSYSFAVYAFSIECYTY